MSAVNERLKRNFLNAPRIISQIRLVSPMPCEQTLLISTSAVSYTPSPGISKGQQPPLGRLKQRGQRGGHSISQRGEGGKKKKNRSRRKETAPKAYFILIDILIGKLGAT